MPIVTLPTLRRRNYLRLRIRMLAFAASLFVFLSASRVEAQSVDSLSALLGSTDVLTRSAAVHALSRLPVSGIPGATRDALIALLEKEATGMQQVDPVPPSEDDEAWGEYIIELTSMVRTLNDSRSLRGLALLGIQTSRDAQEFVAGFGALALPALNEAWTTKPDARPSVITTWALMANTADSATKGKALQRLLAPEDTFPIALADAAVAGNLVVFVPLLDSLARTGTFLPIVQGALTEAADQLRPAFAGLSATELLSQLTTVLDAICLNATGPLNGYCESSANGVENSTKHLLKTSGDHVQQGFATQARQEIQTVIDRTMTAVTTGVLSSTQGIAVVSGLRQVIARIS